MTANDAAEGISGEMLELLVEAQAKQYKRMDALQSLVETRCDTLERMLEDAVRRVTLAPQDMPILPSMNRVADMSCEATAGSLRPLPATYASSSVGPMQLDHDFERRVASRAVAEALAAVRVEVVAARGLQKLEQRVSALQALVDSQSRAVEQLMQEPDINKLADVMLRKLIGKGAVFFGEGDVSPMSPDCFEFSEQQEFIRSRRTSSKERGEKDVVSGLGTLGAPLDALEEHDEQCDEEADKCGEAHALIRAKVRKLSLHAELATKVGAVLTRLMFVMDRRLNDIMTKSDARSASFSTSFPATDGPDTADSHVIESSQHSGTARSTMTSFPPGEITGVDAVREPSEPTLPGTLPSSRDEGRRLQLLDSNLASELDGLVSQLRAVVSPSSRPWPATATPACMEDRGFASNAGPNGSPGQPTKSAAATPVALLRRQELKLPVPLSRLAHLDTSILGVPAGLRPSTSVLRMQSMPSRSIARIPNVTRQKSSPPMLTARRFSGYSSFFSPQSSRCGGCQSSRSPPHRREAVSPHTCVVQTLSSTPKSPSKPQGSPLASHNVARQPSSTSMLTNSSSVRQLSSSPAPSNSSSRWRQPQSYRLSQSGLEMLGERSLEHGLAMALSFNSSRVQSPAGSMMHSVPDRLILPTVPALTNESQVSLAVQPAREGGSVSLASTQSPPTQPSSGTCIRTLGSSSGGIAGVTREVSQAQRPRPQLTQARSRISSPHTLQVSAPRTSTSPVDTTPPPRPRNATSPANVAQIPQSGGVQSGCAATSAPSVTGAVAAVAAASMQPLLGFACRQGPVLGRAPIVNNAAPWSRPATPPPTMAHNASASPWPMGSAPSGAASGYPQHGLWGRLSPVRGRMPMAGQTSGGSVGGLKPAVAAPARPSTPGPVGGCHSSNSASAGGAGGASAGGGSMTLLSPQPPSAAARSSTPGVSRVSAMSNI